jgi:hypothetical protein
LQFPETKKRSLEEIDLIFAKGYIEKMTYVRAAKELPHLDDRGIAELSAKYGFASSDDAAGQLRAEKDGELPAAQQAAMA